MNKTDIEYWSNYVGETNPVGDMQELLNTIDEDECPVELSDERLVQITRLRLIGYHKYEYPYWDVSYCYGKLADGRTVRVDFFGHEIGGNYKADILRICQEAGRYGKGLGIFEAISTLHG